MSLAILGAGAFGTALAQTYAASGKDVILWARSSEHVKAMRETRQNARYLPHVTLHQNITTTDDLDKIHACEAIFLAVPAQKMRDFAQEHHTYLQSKPLISCAKGIDLTTLKTPATLLADTLGHDQVFALSGPGFARDLARGLPTAMVLAGASDTLEAVQHTLASATLRLYRSDHRSSVELGGALKNIIAIGCGAVMGAGLGESARASILTRGFAEMGRILHAMECNPTPLQGLSGLGDLTLTALSESSRNYRHGMLLGSGGTIDPSTTVEGVATAQAMRAMAERLTLDLPIIDAIAALCAQETSVADLIPALMQRDLKEE